MSPIPMKRRQQLDRAVRTFRTWHEFDAHELTLEDGPPMNMPHTLVKLGELIEVVYRSNKYDGESKLYVHAHERPYPLLCTDPDGRHLYIVGGKVKVTGDGLVG